MEKEMHPDTTLIAIVDDDPGMRRMVYDLLRSLDYAVAHFASAEEFLDWSAANDASCVIADVKMPGIGGIELQRRLIAKGKRIPVIFMTAFPEDSIRTRAIDAGAVGFLPKPFPQECLVNCLERALHAA
jgi:FixJ family two-component response regulator